MEAIENYRKWILSYNFKDAKVSEKEGNIRIDTDYAAAEVNFYEFQMLVVELRITSLKDNETAFFLHFELRDLDYAKELFVEMTETLEELRKNKSVQILLSCTSALTTGLLAQKLEDAATLSNVDFVFNAVPFSELYEKAPQYDMILLAPQIAYEGARIRGVITDKPVIDIPARLFATYDAPAILELARREFTAKKARQTTEKNTKSASVSQIETRILTLALLHQGRGLAQIICRCYKNGSVINEKKYIRRPRNFFREVCDILDTTRAMGGHFDAIGITMPGEIWEGRVFLNLWKLADENIKESLEKRYKVPVTLRNNAQAGAFGFWMRHKHYTNAVLLSQSEGARFGGAGIIANGKLLGGSHNVAGEIKYILRRIYGLTIRENHGVSPDEMLETMDFYARCVISLIDPEIILVRNSLISDIDLLRKSLLRTVPERNIPKLRKISDSDALEYMLLGIMALCIEAKETE